MWCSVRSVVLRILLAWSSVGSVLVLSLSYASSVGFSTQGKRNSADTVAGLSLKVLPLCGSGNNLRDDQASLQTLIDKRPETCACRRREPPYVLD